MNKTYQSHSQQTTNLKSRDSTQQNFKHGEKTEKKWCEYFMSPS